MSICFLIFFFNVFLYARSLEAVADANRAIELDPSMSKAYFRKGLVPMLSLTYSTSGLTVHQLIVLKLVFLAS